MEIPVPAIDAVPDTLPRSTLIGEKGPSDIASEKEGGRKREEEKRDDNERDILGEVEAIR